MGLPRRRIEHEHTMGFIKHLRLPVALLAAALTLTGCDASKQGHDPVEAAPMIEKVIEASGATHIGFAGLDTDGIFQFITWDGTVAEYWSVQGSSEPTSDGEFPGVVPSSFVPVDQMDWDGLYGKALQVKVDNDCFSGGIEWTVWPGGQVQESLMCDYTTYIEGSTTVDGVPFPDTLEVNDAAGLDEAFRLVEQVLPGGVVNIEWETPASELVKVSFTAPDVFQTELGEDCWMKVQITGEIPELSYLPPTPPFLAGCETYEPASSVEFVPSQAGGQAIMDAYEQTIPLMQYEVEDYWLAEVRGREDGSVVFVTAGGPPLARDIIEVPVAAAAPGDVSGDGPTARASGTKTRAVVVGARSASTSAR